MTLEQAVRQGEARLAAGPHPDRARRDAETLLLHVIRRNRAAMLARWNEVLIDTEVRAVKELIERRLAGEPIQYIVGEAEFYGLPFRVTSDVLIPRPETEHLVEKALQLAARFPSPRIVDVGTGSGAIAVALAYQLAKQAEGMRDFAATGPDLSVKGTGFSPEGTSLCTENSGLSLKGTGFSPYKSSTSASGALAPEGPSFSVTAIDISPQALALAEQNANRNRTPIRFLLGDLLAPVAAESFELILSNPPYVPATDRSSLSVEVRDHEPPLALFAGNDGLSIYRRLVPSAHTVLVPGGFLLLEIGFGQQQAILELLAASNFASIQFIPDLQNIPRIACSQKAC
jgi:release factor glutamine methyltransferase